MTTNASSNLQPGARQYLEATATHLADLDVSERGELVSDIADALSEQPDDSSFEDLVVGLGAPSVFARELRESAGSAPAPAVDATPTVAIDSQSADTAPTTPREPLVQRTGSALVWTGRELEPLWWVLRGIAVAAIVFIASQAIGFDFGYSSREVLVVMGLVAVGVSTASGVRTRLRELEGDARPVEADAILRRRGIGIIAVGVVTVVAMSNLMSTSNDTGYPYPFEETGGGVDGLYLDGGQVSNVYAFDADGHRIEQVRLFTDAGEPLDVGYVGVEDPQRETFADATSGELRNVFPIRYLDEATGRVEEPNAGWPQDPGTLRPNAAVADVMEADASVEAAPARSGIAEAATAAVEAEPAADEPSAAKPSVAAPARVAR